MQIDRVRAHTAEQNNARIDHQTDVRLLRYQDRSDAEISAWIAALDREWDIERVLELNASALAFTGLALGMAKDRKWLI